LIYIATELIKCAVIYGAGSDCVFASDGFLETARLHRSSGLCKDQEAPQWDYLINVGRVTLDNQAPWPRERRAGLDLGGSGFNPRPGRNCKRLFFRGFPL
jgi:hypothetical protein